MLYWISFWTQLRKRHGGFDVKRIIIFQKIKFKLSTFSKFQQFVELFQKRFAGGICDFKGGPTVYSLAPYIWWISLSVIHRGDQFSKKKVKNGWRPVRPEILARSRRFCAQSIRSIRNTCLSTKEHQNPSSMTEVPPLLSRRGRKKGRPGFGWLLDVDIWADLTDLVRISYVKRRNFVQNHEKY